MEVQWAVLRQTQDLRNTSLVLALYSGQRSYCTGDRATSCSQEASSYPPGVHADTNEVALGGGGGALLTEKPDCDQRARKFRS